VPKPPDNTMKDVNSNESNIGEESHSFDRQGSLEVDPTLIGSLDINYGCCHVDAIRLLIDLCNCVIELLFVYLYYQLCYFNCYFGFWSMEYE